MSYISRCGGPPGSQIKITAVSGIAAFRPPGHRPQRRDVMQINASQHHGERFGEFPAAQRT